MLLSEEISKCFNSKYSLINSEEKFESADFTLTGSGISLPMDDALSHLFSQIGLPDKFELQLTFAETIPITFQSGQNTIRGLLTEIQNRQQFYTKGEKIEFRLSIIKKKRGSRLNIYNIAAFTLFLKSLSVEQLLINFSAILSGNPYVVFNCFDLTESLSSKTIYFIPNSEIGSFKSNLQIDREDILNKIHTNCSITFSEPLILVPEDFFLTKHPSSIKGVQEIFDKILYPLLIAGIFDITTIKDDSIIYKLNGYKSLAGNLKIGKALASSNNYYNIYSWIYTGGNLSDKIGLARNIISLHLGEKGSLEISDTAYPSIVSSHKVYEKQNIKQYIELRNKISDQIYNFNEKANKIIESFASGFQKSALAFVSLFSTIVITRVLTTKDFTNVFTFDATIISLLFLSGSLIYFFVSLWEVNAQLKRFGDSYQNMKERNEDLLTKDDINKILNNDAEHDTDKTFIRSKRKYYSIIWLSFLLLFLAATIIPHWQYAKSKPGENNLFKLFQKPNTAVSKAPANVSNKPTR